jgi:hypothetical protein
MSKSVKELYECDGISKGTKYVLVIYDDLSVKLTLYNGTVKFEEPAVKIKPVGLNGGRAIEYGTTHSMTSIPFRKYIDGSLDERWTQIK